MTKINKKLIIFKNNNEKFTESKCDCLICLDIKKENKLWNSYKITTNLQNKMKNVIKNIEKKYC
jgi:hypothetical protein